MGQIATPGSDSQGHTELPADEDFDSYEGTTFVEEASLKDDEGREDSDEARPVDEAAPTFALVCPLLRTRIPLETDKSVSIGRSPDANIVLPAKKVSRIHAEIRFDGQAFSIHDNNSTNGTFVNGARIHRRRRLRPGMRIDIGAFTFEVVELAALDEDVDLGTEDQASCETSLDLNADLGGMLEEISVAEVVQFIESTGRTGTLTFYRKEGVGQVWVEDGRVRHAELGAEYGEKAALMLFGMRQGRFEFRRTPISCPQTVTKPTTYLLMEAARLADEAEMERTDQA